jgi:hypothetical protein
VHVKRSLSRRHLRTFCPFASVDVLCQASQFEWRLFGQNQSPTSSSNFGEEHDTTLTCDYSRADLSMARRA